MQSERFRDWFVSVAPVGGSDNTCNMYLYQLHLQVDQMILGLYQFYLQVDQIILGLYKFHIYQPILQALQVIILGRVSFWSEVICCSSCLMMKCGLFPPHLSHARVGQHAMYEELHLPCMWLSGEQVFLCPKLHSTYIYQIILLLPQYKSNVVCSPHLCYARVVSYEELHLPSILCPKLCICQLVCTFYSIFVNM